MTILDQQIFHAKPVARLGGKRVDRAFIAAVEERAKRIESACKRGRAKELPLLKMNK